MMKKFLAVTCLLMLIAAPAWGALKMLEAELAAELEGIAKAYLAEQQNVEVSAITLSEAWVHEFKHIGEEVYTVILLIGDNKFVTYVDIVTKEMVNDEAFEALVEAETEAAVDSDMFFTLAIGFDTGEGEASITSAPEAKNYTPYYVAGAAVLALGAGALVIRRRVTA